MPETPYTETEIVLAVMNEDTEHARELIDGMSMYERRIFAGQLDDAAELVRG
jgi:hypothetical protein